MKKLLLIPLVLVVAGCAPTYHYSWQRHIVDAHRTGVTPSSADNVDETMGVVKDGVYTAPNGATFTCGSTPAVAYDMIAAQPRMSALKSVVGHCTEDMHARSPQSALSNWAVDEVMRRTEELTGKKVDIGLLNFGGIRSSFTKGEILRDDVDSMFPFKNYLCYVKVPGTTIKAIFENFAKHRMEVVGGVKVVVRNGSIESFEIGGEPFDENRDYGVATIDFLLDGGDRISVAKDARELIQTGEKLGVTIMNLVARTEAAGKPVAYQVDDRVTIIKEEAE